MRLFIVTLFLTIITTAAYAINPVFFATVSGQGGGAAGISCAFDLTGVSYASKVSGSLTSLDGTPRGAEWVNDNNSVLYLGDATDDVFQLDCTTPGNISTCSDSGNSFSANEQYSGSVSAAVDSKNDMSIVWVMENNGNIDQYACTTGDVSTCSYDSKTIATSGDGTGTPWGFDVTEDGAKLYVIYDNASTNYNITEYDCSTAYDVSSCTTNGNTYTDASETEARGLRVGFDGGNVFAIGFTTDSIYESDMSSSFDISTASSDQSLSVSSEGGVPVDISIAKDCSNIIMLDFINRRIYQYE